ncbi:hypothetical protein L596_029302 [Steinernema carpocapsae]|uniref:Uncharacterized protein n=1 Tax=Steinernema carpocapsae TaxID=34508 RepID=A0A4U5LU88_STECR|nr:hypothetical protein L596_029302 [Steinernema carpocapsae]
MFEFGHILASSQGSAEDSINNSLLEKGPPGVLGSSPQRICIFPVNRIMQMTVERPGNGPRKSEIVKLTQLPLPVYGNIRDIHNDLIRLGAPSAAAENRRPDAPCCKHGSKGCLRYPPKSRGNPDRWGQSVIRKTRAKARTGPHLYANGQHVPRILRLSRSMRSEVNPCRQNPTILRSSWC